MTTYTPNYNLKKPSQEDIYNVNDFNDNFSVIDEKFKENDDNIKQVNKQMADLKEFLRYMPINGGDFDGNNVTGVVIDGGTY